MKRSFAFFAVLVATAIPAAAQNQTRERRVSNEPGSGSIEKPARTRVVADQRDANHVRQPVPSAGQPTSTNKKGAPAWGDTSVAVQEAPRQASGTSVAANPILSANSLTQPKLVKPTMLTTSNVRSSPNAAAITSPGNTANPPSIYRVGIGDVLDIRLSNLATRESTLFTVLKNGAIEHPLLEKPLPVAGMTTDEIARHVNAELKVIQNARASVTVRDYASHSVIVGGSVDNPGQKILRREAMPLFAILAEALPRVEATTATILRDGKETSISLANNEQMATLVMPGDAIKISSATKQFVYVGGAVASAGEKEFREGMTLTQLLLAAGGTRGQASVKITRRDSTGFLKSEEHDLEAIGEGKALDPLLQPGDRIEVKPSM